ncbi:MAG TPA: DUF4037 domain-containing protein [Ktedonobacterales bacterium]|jgi:hypothetical protein|nr:DUF4037 domain-containing protein [Ktedonobacterales bacterium]
MPEFVHGLDLNRAFYREAVQPLLDARFPDLGYAAALIGAGSDVLGYDTPRSTDHEWGPRLLIILPDGSPSELGIAIEDALRAELPVAFWGYPTSFGPRDGQGVRLPVEGEVGHVAHHVDVWTLRAFTRSQLGIEPGQPLRAVDWLAFPEQLLLQVTGGEVFHDGQGGLTAVRERLRYYPHAVWLYLMAAQWMRLAEIEPFVGRIAEAGDDLGSRLVTASLAHDLMKLSFLHVRQYAPYSKWFGTAFAQLPVAKALGPTLQRALAAADWQAREEALLAAYTIVAERHNALGVTPPLDPHTSQFFGRPYRVLAAERFAEALVQAVEDEEVTEILRAAGRMGAIDQISDSTDLLTRPAICRRVRALYEDDAAERSER